MEGVRPAPIATVNSVKDLANLLKQHALDAERTHDSWTCSPHATWIATLLSELPPEHRAELQKRQRKLQVLSADDFGMRWELSAEFAKAACDLWCKGRTLDEVLAKSEALGHTELPGGVVLSGALVKEWAAGHDVHLTELMRWVRALTPDSSALLYRVQPANHFTTDAETSAPLDRLEDELRERVTSGRGGAGALNSTHDYADGHTESGVLLIDELMGQLDELTYVADPSALQLNTRLYLIWKLGGYCTPYHQDIHVPPHLTLYNQVSGCSTFHFLPLLVGLYASSVGRSKGPEALAALIDTLRARGVGQVATIGPKQMVLILPSGAHGVYVPRVPRMPDADAAAEGAMALPDADAAADGAAPPPIPTPPENAGLPRFEYSVIRAAEVFVEPLRLLYERRLMAAPSDGWCSVIKPSAAEVEAEACSLARFRVAQEALCRQMGLSRDEWLYLATKLQQGWEAVPGEEGRRREDGSADDVDDLVDQDDSL